MGIEDKNELRVTERLQEFAKSFEQTFGEQPNWRAVRKLHETELFERQTTFTKQFLFDETIATHLKLRDQLAKLGPDHHEIQVMLNRPMSRDEGPAVQEHSPLEAPPKKGKKSKK